MPNWGRFQNILLTQLPLRGNLNAKKPSTLKVDGSVLDKSLCRAAVLEPDSIHDYSDKRSSPVISVYASRYRRLVASATSSGSGGAGGFLFPPNPLRYLPAVFLLH